MRLESARALKRQMRQEVRQELIERLAFSVRGVERPLWMNAPSPVVAFGVTPLRLRQFGLAVRVFAGQERAARKVLAQVRAIGAEVDVVMGVRYAPRLTLRAGGSCGHYQITAGTLGGFVEDATGYYVLSNNHVLANSDSGRRGDPILQPGPSDIVQRYAVIANLERWVPLSATRTDGFDAATAAFSPDVHYFYPWEYRGIGTMSPTPVADRYATSEVVKRGRTTKVTHGRVSAFELDGVAVNYGTSRKPFVVTFDDQLEFVGEDPRVPFSQPGDSGSFILDRATLQPYALLYAGGPDVQGIDRTLGHFMPNVLDSLGTWLVQ